jgi:hypothetical protein
MEVRMQKELASSGLVGSGSQLLNDKEKFIDTQVDEPNVQAASRAVRNG